VAAFSLLPAHSAQRITLILEAGGGTSGETVVSTQIIPPEANYIVSPSIGSQVNTIQVDIVCSFFGAAIPDCAVTINPPAIAESNTGGHSHGDAGRPLGKLDPLQGNTGSDAVFTTTYTAPEVSGVVRVSGSGFHSRYGFFSGSFTIGIMVGGLQELVESSDYDRIGIKTIHPQSHFGTSTMVGNLTKLAQAYKATFPGHRLGYNDISLPWGGIFDLGANWSPDHKAHRLGTHVDADISLVPENRRKELRELIEESGLSRIILEYPTHWHLTQN